MSHYHSSMLTLITAAMISSLFTSCASGPDYTGLQNSAALTPAKDKALVVVYREAGLAGMASKPYVWVNGALLPGQLSRGGFYTQQVSPGTQTVTYAWERAEYSSGEALKDTLTGGLTGLILSKSTHKRHAINLDAMAGSTHYVLFDGRELQEVSKADASDALAECRLLNASGHP